MSLSYELLLCGKRTLPEPPDPRALMTGWIAPDRSLRARPLAESRRGPVTGARPSSEPVSCCRVGWA